MSEQKDTDLSEVVPPAAPLIGDPADPDQRESAVPLASTGGEDEVTDDDRRRRDEQA